MIYTLALTTSIFLIILGTLNLLLGLKDQRFGDFILALITTLTLTLPSIYIVYEWLVK